MLVIEALVNVSAVISMNNFFFNALKQKQITIISCIIQHLLYKAAVFFVCLSVCLSVCLYPPFFFDTTVGPQPNLAHIFG